MKKEVSEALMSDKWTESEKNVIRWIFNLHGSFYTALFELFSSADPINLKKLESAFPVEVEGFRNWRDGNLGERIEKEIGFA